MPQALCIPAQQRLVINLAIQEAPSNPAQYLLVSNSAISEALSNPLHQPEVSKSEIQEAKKTCIEVNMKNVDVADLTLTYKNGEDGWDSFPRGIDNK